jgi:hypothetical protein
MEAAGKLAKIFPVLAKFTAILGIVFSIPAALKWTAVINSGDFMEKMQDADERANFAVDLSNLISSAMMFIPGLQPVALALGAVSLAIQGGQAAIHHFVAPNQQDQLINANNPEEKKQLVDKMSREDQFNVQNQDWWVNELFNEIQPGFSDFNDYVRNKLPRAIDTTTNKPGEFYDPSKVKAIDLMNSLTSWIQSLPTNRQKNYSWFINPTDENKQMRQEFLQKLNQWLSSQKQPMNNVVKSFNLKKHQLMKV